MRRLTYFQCFIVAATLIAATTVLASGTTYVGQHDGRSVEFFGPDDLHLDPATNVIAVDVYGDRDRVVNGVTFRSDGRVEGIGTATNQTTGVSVTTTAANVIDNWSAAPAFTGADRTSASNLAEVMRDLRYEDAPGPVTVDILGLTPGALYEVQILINEGADRNRQFDIAVEGELVVDNFTSEGEAPDAAGNGGQKWAPNNSFAYVGNFHAPPDGELTIVMQHDIGGEASMGTDVDLGYQALVVHLLPPRILPILELTHSAGDLVFKWESLGGKLYNLRSETNPSAADPLDWPIFAGQGDLAATPPESTLTVPLPSDPFRLFVIEEVNAPPVSAFSDDFESGQGDWMFGSDGEAGTAWELGTPANLGPPAANGGANCFGTNLAANYEFNADIWLRSPAIDLTTAGGATFRFFHFVDIEESFDLGRVAILDASDHSELAVIESAIDGFTIRWEQITRALPPAALGKVIKLEFRFQSDELGSFAGWYIDDVEVTIP